MTRNKTQIVMATDAPSAVWGIYAYPSLASSCQFCTYQ